MIVKDRYHKTKRHEPWIPEGVLLSSSQRSAVEPGEGQMGNVRQARRTRATIIEAAEVLDLLPDASTKVGNWVIATKNLLPWPS